MANPSGTASTDEAVFEVLATAEHPLSTSQIAERLNLPRTSTWDLLKPLEEKGWIYSWNVHRTTRVWDVPGNFGQLSISEVYGASPLDDYFQTGTFSADVSWEEVAGAIEEALIEVNWGMPLNGGVRYKEMKALADLFQMPLPEFMQLSPNDIYSLLHDGAIHDLPREGYELPDGTIVDERSPEAFRDIRKAERVSQKSVGTLANVPQPKVSDWENGKVELNRSKVDLLWEALKREVGGSDGNFSFTSVKAESA